jgi:hypothetical protein
VRRFGIFDHLDDGGSPSASSELTTIRPNMRMGARHAGTVLRRRVVDRDTGTQLRKRVSAAQFPRTDYRP